MTQRRTRDAIRPSCSRLARALLLAAILWNASGARAQDPQILFEDSTHPGFTSTDLSAPGGVVIPESANHWEARFGRHLVYGFDRFNVPTGRLEFTHDTAGLDSLVLRVSGNDASSIGGLIASSLPHLYLLNPNGVLFGAGARVDVTGSFLASAGDRLGFGDQLHLYAGRSLDLAPDSILRPGNAADFGFLGVTSPRASLSDATEFGDGSEIEVFDTFLGSNANGDLDDLTLSARTVRLGRTLFLIDDQFHVAADTIDLAPGTRILQRPGFGAGRGTRLGGPAGAPASTISIRGAAPADGGATTLSGAEGPGIEIDGQDVSITGTTTLRLGPEGQADPSISIFARDLTLNGTVITVKPEDTNDSDPRITLVAARDIELRGETLIEAEADAEAQGVGGTVEIIAGGTIRMIEDAEGAAPRVTSGSVTGASTNAGSVLFDAGESILLRGGRVEAASRAGDGGNVTLRANDVVAVRDVGSVRASAVVAAGGRIAIEADQTIAAPGAFDATGGTNGEVIIASPVTNLEGQVAPPPTEILDASSMLLARCSARRTGERAGTFSIDRWPRAPTSFWGPLLAFAQMESDSDRAEEERERTETGPEVAGDATAKLLAAAEMLRNGRPADADARFADLALRSSGAIRSDALRGVAQARQLGGAFLQSVEPLREALAEARAAADRPREAVVLTQLAIAHLAMRDHSTAEARLSAALEIARALEDPALLARVLNEIGNLRAARQQWDTAAVAYLESLGFAQQEGAPLLATQVLANAARVLLARGNRSDAARLLDEAGRMSDQIDGHLHHERIAVFVHLADTLARFAQVEPEARRRAIERAHRLLMRASGDAIAAGDPRAQSLIHGSLGDLYVQEGGRDEEALYLTQRALALAERARSPELLTRWYAQAAAISRGRGDLLGAIELLGAASDVLDSARRSHALAFGGADRSFSEAIAPVYLALLDANLAQSALEPDDGGAQRFLRSARSAVERLKAAELRDYFQDDCVAALESRVRPIESLAPNAAVVYPVLLPDRIELLVSTRGRISRHSVVAAADEVTRSVRLLRRRLMTRSTNRFRKPAKRLYDWLVRPYAEDLARSGVDTLVFVPDGALRTIPMTALHDGDRFLMERFAVAVTPSLELLEPRALDPRNERILFAGVSEAVQGHSPLPFAAKELETLRDRIGGELLLDAAFRLDRLEESIRERRPAVVHLATHAMFTGDPDSSYVLTHDGRLSMDRLSSVVSAERFSEAPLELLVLSACETAAGNDRAALGLSGVAIRAGARSAIGSLWSVDDAASTELMIEFYEGLGSPGSSKAKAMQRAQQKLASSTRYRHPFYWSGFLVINNWL